MKNELIAKRQYYYRNNIWDCFFSIGLYIITNRKNVISALLSSNKVFWKNMSFHHSFLHNEKIGKFLTNIMIPFMGAMFLVVGVLLICKIIIIYMK